MLNIDIIQHLILIVEIFQLIFDLYQLNINNYPMAYTSFDLGAEEKEALEQVMQEMIEPFFGKSNQTQAINFCIRYTLRHGVTKKQTA